MHARPDDVPKENRVTLQLSTCDFFCAAWFLREFFLPVSPSGPHKAKRLDPKPVPPTAQSLPPKIQIIFDASLSPFPLFPQTVEVG